MKHRMSIVLAGIAMLQIVALVGCSKKEPETTYGPAVTPTIGGAAGAPQGAAAKTPPPGAVPGGGDTFVNGSGK